MTTRARLRPVAAGFWAGFYWTAFTLGRFAAGLVAGKLGTRRLLRGSLPGRHAACGNTIGIQISAAGLGSALIPALAGVLARNLPLEIIPVFLIALVLLLISIVLVSSRQRHTLL